MLNKAWLTAAVILFFVCCFSFTAKAATDTNQMPRRGESSSRISGYEISNVHYRLSEDPSLLEAVEFDIESGASQVLIAFEPSADHSFSCQEQRGQHSWYCKVENVRVAAIQELRVYAVGQ